MGAGGGGGSAGGSQAGGSATGGGQGGGAAQGGGSAGGSSTGGGSAGGGSSGGGASGCADGDTCDLGNGLSGTCCSGVCGPTLDHWAANCGACGNACGTYYSCFQSQCVPEVTCATTDSCLFADGGIGGSCCASDPNGCFDLQGDLQNCGRCGLVCDAGMTCYGGSCLLSDCLGPSSASQYCVPDAGLMGFCCAGTCRDMGNHTDTDCGGCGHACPSGSMCNDFGQCIDSNNQIAACNSSGAAQCGSGRTCVQGVCVLVACQSGESGAGCAAADGQVGQCCGTVCSDPHTDALNCGGCGVSCGAGWCDYGICRAPVNCSTAQANTKCPLGGLTPGVCCGGTCIDGTTDTACGFCGLQCAAGLLCNGGFCGMADGGYGTCGAQSCAPGFTCAASSACAVVDCTTVSEGTACAYGTPYALSDSYLGTCCGGSCVLTDRSAENCGACGAWCDGVCTPNFCLPFTPDAGGSGCTGVGCFDPTLSCAENICATNDAGFANPARLCVTDRGTLGAYCQIGPVAFGCRDLRSDRQNCGQCSWQCPGNQACVNGTCVGTPPSCGNGHQDQFCSPDGGTQFVCCPSGCADLHVDPANCGVCGFPCNSSQQCVNGQCQ
jgi:hypothetical protein